MKLRLSELAQQQIETTDAWWHQNRTAARALFFQELRSALRQIEASPGSGTLYLVGTKRYRRVVLPRTRYLLYYEYDEATDLVAVVSVWSARRGEPPAL